MREKRRDSETDKEKREEKFLRVGVDTGGTFTDFVAIYRNHRVAFKIPSTPDAPERSILIGLQRVLEYPEINRDIDAVSIEIVHGTTVATNALLERKGARAALVTTAGFEDVIEIGRQARPDLYNWSVIRPNPIIPHELRFGVKERIAHDSSVIEPLNEREIAGLVRKLRRAKVESVALCLLFSFANPSHERAIAEALKALDLPVSISHLILPEHREYERSSTIAINAYLAPRVSGYLSELKKGISRQFGGNRKTRLRIMQSSGGSISAEVASREPVRTILSGPAGGVVAATHIAKLAGVNEIITFDMGGTSTDVALCRGPARTTDEAQVAGLPVAIPMLDIQTIGAGGGSIAYVDAGGALRVGPESAGADPGPACYGKGTRPTVTDANLVLGRFAGGGLLSGEIKIDMDRAAEAIDELAVDISKASSKKVKREQAAAGVIRVANANMERALRLVSVERGHDPRLFTLVSFGGAGGLHAAALAAALRIPRVLIPSYPGAFSALGVLIADVVKNYSRTVMIAATISKRNIIEQYFAALEKKALMEMKAEGFTGHRLKLARSLAMRYVGQSYQLEIEAGEDVTARFHLAHRERYGHADQNRAVEIVSLHLSAIGLTEKPVFEHAVNTRKFEAKPMRTTRVWTEGRREDVSVYDRAGLRPGAMIKAPAIVIEYGSTTIVPAGWLASIDVWGNLELRGKGEIAKHAK